MRPFLLSIRLLVALPATAGAALVRAVPYVEPPLPPGNYGCAKYMNCPVDMMVFTAAPGEQNNVSTIITGSVAGSTGNAYGVGRYAAKLVYAGDDQLLGGRQKDNLSGGGGRDALSRRGGNDFLVGGPGNDRLRGGGGKDVLRGSSGEDSLEARELRSLGERTAKDDVDCGPGRRDRAVADRRDRVTRCERVSRTRRRVR